MTEWFEQWCDSDGRSCIERLRLFGSDERTAMARNASLRRVRQFGHCGGAPVTDPAPRTILMAETS